MALGQNVESHRLLKRSMRTVARCSAISPKISNDCVVADTHAVLWLLFDNARPAKAFFERPREAVPDMPDRIVAATAFFLGVPLIIRDGHSRASNVRTVR
jgi:PIN domain nuclease of toxin-antitoxin system